MEEQSDTTTFGFSDQTSLIVKFTQFYSQLRLGNKILLGFVVQLVQAPERFWP